jgi:hypothetical protein
LEVSEQVDEAATDVEERLLRAFEEGSVVTYSD